MALRREAPVVKNVISAAEVLIAALPPFTHVEVRENSKSAWHVFYPDPGWIPCAPVCHLKHKHDYEQGWIETHYIPTSFADALDWAGLLAEGREVKVVPYMTARERNAAKAKALTAGA